MDVATLGLCDTKLKNSDHLAGPSISRIGVQFLALLGADEMAFDNLYCVAFQLLDSKWVSMRASYMEFNVILTCYCCFCYVRELKSLHMILSVGCLLAGGPKVY